MRKAGHLELLGFVPGLGMGWLSIEGFARNSRFEVRSSLGGVELPQALLFSGWAWRRELGDCETCAVT
jgi:hypothetical protein